MSVSEEPILVGVGANLFLNDEQAPLTTCKIALQKMEGLGMTILQRSSWYLTSPVPADDQPWYINGVVSIASDLLPNLLLRELLLIEKQLGRLPDSRGGARTIDLDLLAYGGRICDNMGNPSLTLPHPRMAERGFVMLPLSEILPYWLHPVLGVRAEVLAAESRSGQKLVRVSP